MKSVPQITCFSLHTSWAHKSLHHLTSQQPVQLFIYKCFELTEPYEHLSNFFHLNDHEKSVSWIFSTSQELPFPHSCHEAMSYPRIFLDLKDFTLFLCYNCKPCVATNFPGFKRLFPISCYNCKHV